MDCIIDGNNIGKGNIIIIILNCYIERGKKWYLFDIDLMQFCYFLYFVVCIKCDNGYSEAT